MTSRKVITLEIIVEDDDDQQALLDMLDESGYPNTEVGTAYWTKDKD